MKPGDPKERYDRVMRWMLTNLEIGCSVYQSTDGALRVDPNVKLADSGEVERLGNGKPSDWSGWQLNSTSLVVATCYMDALGKVLLHGAAGASNQDRIAKFIHEHVPTFEHECHRKGTGHGISDFYRIYRCGFVHQFADVDAHWGRHGRGADYWFDADGEPGINVDRLVAGTFAGITDFRSKFITCPQHQPDPHEKFFNWLGI